MLQLLIRKIIADGGKGVLLDPHWPAKAWYGQLFRHATSVKVFHPQGDGYSLLPITKKLNAEWFVVLPSM